MTPKTVTYYDYVEDVLPKLCEYMGIEKKYFRDYHKIVGGDYKDCWHALLDLWDFEFKGNDSFMKIYDDNSGEYDHKYHSSEYPWAGPVYDAVARLHREYGEQLVIWFSW